MCEHEKELMTKKKGEKTKNKNKLIEMNREREGKEKGSEERRERLERERERVVCEHEQKLDSICKHPQTNFKGSWILPLRQAYIHIAQVKGIGASKGHRT